MKRAIIFILTLVISLSCCVPAFAEIDINEIDGTNEVIAVIMQNEELMKTIIDCANNDNSFKDEEEYFNIQNTVLVDSMVNYRFSFSKH